MGGKMWGRNLSVWNTTAIMSLDPQLEPVLSNVFVSREHTEKGKACSAQQCGQIGLLWGAPAHKAGSHGPPALPQSGPVGTLRSAHLRVTRAPFQSTAQWGPWLTHKNNLIMMICQTNRRECVIFSFFQTCSCQLKLWFESIHLGILNERILQMPSYFRGKSRGIKNVIQKKETF